LDEYLSNIPISDDDPALLFVWNLDALIQFVELANAVNPENRRNPSPPAWFATIAPNITAVTLTNDIVAHLAPHAGGRCENVMLAPNTLIQALNVRDALKEVELHPFIQHCMRRLPAGVFLAHTYVLTDRAVACAKPAERAAPDAPHRQVFQ
jgi:hypothetical protein